MVKLLKILGKTLGICLEWILVLIIFLAFAIRTSSFQTYLAQELTAYLSKELNVEIGIEKVSIIFLDKVELEGVILTDTTGDTLIAASSIYASIRNYNFSTPLFHLGEIEIEEANINLVRNADSSFNYQFLRDYFKSERKKKSFTLIVDEVFVHNSHFSYNDNRYERKTQGMDYFHIDAKRINAHVSDFKIENSEYTGIVQSVNCIEKSGFQLDDLYTEVKVASTGLFLSKVAIHSPGSRVYSTKFNMRCTGLIDFKTFVDSVQFDAKLDSSIIDMKEGALFAPILIGMTDTIRLSSELSKEVKNLRLTNFDLRVKEKTNIKGTFNIPDYRNFDQGFFQEKVDYAYIDVEELKQIRLPNGSPSPYISMYGRIERLSYFEAEDVRLDGFYSQFVVASKSIKTALGSIRMDNGIMFTENPENNSYLFEKSGASSYDVQVDRFNLGAFQRDKNLGYVDGLFALSGEAFSIKDIRFTTIAGNVNRFDYLDYPYKHITILEGSLIDGIFKGKIDIKDDNLDMTYDGTVDFQGEPHLFFTVNIERAVLDQLFYISDKRTELSTIMTIDLRGKNPNNYRGTVSLDGFTLATANKVVDVPSLDLIITRAPEGDEFKVNSDLVHGSLRGKLDLNYILDDLNYQLSEVFPAFYEEQITTRDSKKKDEFEFNFEFNQTDNFFSIFYPTLKIAPNTTIQGHYFAERKDLIADIVSDSISFQGMRFNTTNIHQVMTGEHIVSDFHVGTYYFNDSVYFDDVYFKARGNKNVLRSDLVWEQTTEKPSSITWETTVLDPKHYFFSLDPSYFFVQDHRWDIAHASSVTVDNDTIHVHNFELQRNDQLVTMDGILSSKDKHHMNFRVKDFELSELSNFVSEVPIEGKLNAYGYISNPFTNFQYVGDADILQLKTRNQLVGDVKLKSQWVKASQSIALHGDLLYKGNQTFDFIGDYYPKRPSDNLDFNLFFDHTDIQFVNAFLNPEVMSEIKGMINGTLKVSGTPDQPIVDGTVQLLAGSAHVDLLGTHFGVEGAIEADEFGFYINGIPIFDEEGNAGLLIGSIYHDNFQDFNFDLMFDLEIDGVNKDPKNPWMSKPLDRFLVLNSKYEPGDLYYGKGYATGIIDVFGYTDNLDVTVNLDTKQGTKIDIPMYGMGEIEEESFVIFIDKDTTQDYSEPKIDFTGVDLDLNFHVTPDAELKIIFNEDLGDEIKARGNGDMAITLNNIGDVTMNGVFTVSDGVYDFAMGPIKEKFYIQEGGSISWTGDPYEAYLDMRTYYKVNANIASATNDQFGSGSGAHQEILCYLDLTETLSKPTIGFDLAAPKADENAKSVINRIKSDPEELNRQFFSLLLWKRFQPLAGSVLADGSAAIDLVTNQINAILAKVSDDYKLNVNMDSDRLTGDNTYEFGVSTGFLNDRLILSGSFGVENQRASEDNNENSIIGDVNLEYLLNENGTFRINIFNESNDKTIIQTEDQGSFTQGAGLHYKENFHTMDDFKAIQYFLDIFRKKGNKRYPIKRKRKQVPVPENNGQTTRPVESESKENPEILP